MGASPSMMEVTLSMMRLPLSVCSMTCCLSDSAKSVWAVCSWVGCSMLLQSYVRIIRTDVRVVKGRIATEGTKFTELGDGVDIKFGGGA